MSRSSLIAASLMTLVAAAYAAGSGASSKGTSASAASLQTPSSAAARSTASAAAVRSAQNAGGARTLGINVGSHDYYNYERSFANLTMGGQWQLVTAANGWTTMPRSRLDSTGAVKSLAANETASLVMAFPQPSSSGALFRCTYAGTGVLTVRGESISNVQAGDHKFEFRWRLKYPKPDHAWLELRSTNAGDPVRRIDCREANVPVTQLFSKEFVQSLRPFGVIRFLDWSSANSLADGKWAHRTLPTAMVAGEDGIAVEHMVALLKELNADGWFTLPWMADDDYVAKFAQYVHDNLPKERTVYVEVANEVWNGFPAGLQAQQEGLAEGLGSPSNPFDVRMRRYGEKTNQVMRIWTRVFADRPTKLVRVIGSQGVNFGVTQAVLNYSDPNLIDAVAVAPYFGYDLFNDPATASASTSQLMLRLAIKADQSIETMKQLKAYMAPHHKRLITYESGQHVITSNVALAQSIERNPRLYDIYNRYLERWRNEVGDLMMLYNSTTPISQYGSWGLREYNEQPLTLSQTPKRLAAVRFAEALAKRGK